jgi:hypothetical protein
VNYKLRNIIVLSIFVLIISLVGGYFYFYYFPQKIHDINTKIQDLDQKIAALQGIDEEIAQVKTLLEKQKLRLSRLDKQLASSGSPAETYQYINTILKYSGIIDIDLLYQFSNQTENYRYDVYKIKGEGFFPNIYKFLWYLERGPKIYKIKKLSFRGVENREIDSTRTYIVVPFEMELWALFTELEDAPKIKRTLHNVRSYYVRNPFIPYIYRNLPMNSEGLLEVERAELKGILPGRAFIEDYTGQVQVVSEGDKVYLGYVYKIDAENNQVVFILNKGGIIERFTLTLGFE